MSEKNKRGIEDINEMLHLAKLKEDDILTTSQMLHFTDKNLHNNNYKFLELDKYLLEKLEEGQTLYFKGEDDENAVLCTEDRTYDVSIAETSNSLLLVKNMKFFDEIKKENAERKFHLVTTEGIFYEYLEVTPGKPHFKKLTTLLNKSVYKGPEYEYEIKKDELYTYEELLNVVQSSEKEFKKALDSLPVATIDNKVRLLDFEYHFRVLSYMLKLIEENSWALDEIDLEVTVNSLKELVLEEVITGLFEKYTEESKMIDGLQLYSYKEDMVCRFFAQVLLYGAGKFNLDEFLQAWKESVPEGMATDEELLYGIAIVNRNCQPNTIRSFPEENLPEDINKRFEALFNAKEKWTVPEISPYIQRLATDKLNVNALLAKHARASTVNGVKYYSAKHGK